MADLNLDAILYPQQRILVVPVGAEDQIGAQRHAVERHGLSGGHLPGRLLAPTASAPLGVPVGAELFGLDFSEAKLLGYAYAFEQATHFASRRRARRRSPANRHRLPSSP